MQTKIFNIYNSQTNPIIFILQTITIANFFEGIPSAKTELKDPKHVRYFREIKKINCTTQTNLFALNLTA